MNNQKKLAELFYYTFSLLLIIFFYIILIFPKSAQGQEEYYEPGEYNIQIKGCQPIYGEYNAPLKILFLNLNDAPYYSELVNDIIHNQFKNIEPFKYFFDSTSFYSLDISSLRNINEEIKSECKIDDLRAIIKIVIRESEYEGFAGEYALIGTQLQNDVSQYLSTTGNYTPLHEIAHLFGLSDLYQSQIKLDGSAIKVSKDYLTQALNVDNPGCTKWCRDYKPVSQYNQTSASKCIQISDKETCITYNRNSLGICDYENTFPTCCVWSDTPFNYFDSRCIPAYDSENIGLNCSDGTGCYLGGDHSNNAFRPVLTKEESIMMNQRKADGFDPVSEKALTNILRCCLTEYAYDEACTNFRINYSNLLSSSNNYSYYNFNRRIGSCGKKLIEEDSSNQLVKCEAVFPDICENIFREDIEALYNLGVINGYNDGTYKPFNYVTRGQIAKFLVNSFNLEKDISCIPYPDVQIDHVFYNEIMTLKCKNIAKGYTDGTYHPQREITRAEAVKLIVNSMKTSGIEIDLENYVNDVYPDVPPSHTFNSYISYLTKIKVDEIQVIRGYSDGTFRPTQPIDRGQTARIVNFATIATNNLS
ncbi:hypothetical protein GF362_07640 [Candidatus Dojkabacteria bacterium]|nr:hypothetical protein [Candidatus Dojkabacteria bacterium]